MKKFYTLVCAALLGASSMAQTLFESDFEGANPLNGFVTHTTDGASVHANMSQLFQGGDMWRVMEYEEGNNGALTTTWFSAAVQADNYLVLPQVSIPGGASGYKFQFKAQSMDPDYKDPYRVVLSTTGTEKADFTVELHANAGGASENGEVITLDLDAYAGQDIYLAFHANGTDKFILAFDDLFVGVVPPYDFEAVSSDMNSIYPEGNVSITGTLKNVGLENVSSFNLNYRINGGPTETSVISSTVNAQATYDFTHPTVWDAPVGTHTVKFWASNLDGNADGDASNDTLTMEVVIAAASTTRLPLVELFSSATCPPCKTLNDAFSPILAGKKANDQNEAQVAVIKYQVNWPGIGDVFYNDDVAARVTHYGVTGAPTPILDAAEFNATEGELNSAANVPAYMDITASHEVTGDQIEVEVKLTSLADLPAGYKMFIALLNKEYDAPSSSPNFTNGETEFHHVLRKLMPSAAGKSLDALTKNVETTLTETYTFNVKGSHPTQGSYDLIDGNVEVVVFVQSPNGQVMNAAVSQGISNVVGVEKIENLTAFNFFPNPVADIATVAIDMKEATVTRLEVTDIFGKVLMVEDLGTVHHAYTTQVDMSTLASGIYFINVVTPETRQALRFEVVK